MIRAAAILAALLLAAGATPALASDKAPKASSVSSYAALPPVTAAVTKANGRPGVFLINIGLDVKDEQLRTQAALARPRLIDAYGATARTFAASLQPGEVPKVEQLTAALQRDTDRVLKKPGAILLLGGLTIN